MEWSLRKITSSHIEGQVKGLIKIAKPPVGWIKTIRNILGMNTRQLGERCGVTSERIQRIESDELNKKLTMATLEKMAIAMNCRFVYGFVPNEGLINTIEKQAKYKAETRLNRIAHSMALEDQKTSDRAYKEQLEILTEEMLKKSLNKIWEKE